MSRWQTRGELIESTDDGYEFEFLHAHDALSAAGLEHYEVSNFGQRDGIAAQFVVLDRRSLCRPRPIVP